MTELQWLTSADPAPMLKAAQLPRSARKFRLFCCACCRQLWAVLPPESRGGIETAERFADGLSSRAELSAAAARASAAVLALPRAWTYDVLRARYATTAAADCCSDSAATAAGAVSVASTAAHAVALVVSGWGGTRSRDAAHASELAAQAELVRELFGNPHRPTHFPREWLTDNVVSLAKESDQTGDFSPLPILADALQEAGCEEGTVLDHCRSPRQIHVRGCWVIDHVLRKE